MSALKQRIDQDSKQALRAGDKPRLGALRLILAAIKQQEVDTRTALDDSAVLDIVAKMIKKGRDAATQFAQAERTDLATKENAEIAVFESYMPEALGADELAELIATAVRETGAESIKDMGKVMASVKAAAAGRADMSAVSAQVREALAQI